jgi:hypothetical protein
LQIRRAAERAKEQSNMNLEHYLQCRWRVRGLALALGLHFLTASAYANVYPTNIKLNGTQTNVLAVQGVSVTISYVLNEPAALGAKVEILEGSNVVRTMSFSGGGPGTQRGMNTVSWDGKDRYAIAVAPGAYGIRVAASTSHTNWSQITSDSEDTNTYVYAGYGIAVDQNPFSPYYGRVLIANSDNHPTLTDPPNVAGILKFNADTSAAEEGISSAGQDGFNWTGGYVNPWKVSVSGDDYAYVSDLANGGQVYRWDPTMSSNTFLQVLRTDNQPTEASLSGPAILGDGTNTQLWMVDTSGSPDAIRRWQLATNGACEMNDPGLAVVGLGTNLSAAPYALALDTAGHIYTCVRVGDAGNSLQRVFRFPAYDPSTNGNLVETNADWAVGTGDDTSMGASGLAADPSGSYVAVAFEAVIAFGTFYSGNTKILSASDGSLVANLDLGVEIGGLSDHSDTACAWDAVGNVYYIDNSATRWRAVSPPGTNQATTAALGLVQVIAVPPSPPEITRIGTAAGTVTIDFQALTVDTPDRFGVIGAAGVMGPYTAISNATILTVGPGQFRATFPKSGTMEYYRIQRLVYPPQVPQITHLAVGGGMVTVKFTAGTEDSFTAFTLLSASNPNGPYLPAAGAVVDQVSPGLFQATAPVDGPAQFYRIQR